MTINNKIQPSCFTVFKPHVTEPRVIVTLSLLLALVLTQSHQSVVAAEASPEWIYSVRPRDTLIHFGERHLINPDDWRILQKLNRIKDPYRMPIGSKMRVPLHLVKQGPASAEVIFSFGDVYMLNADKTKQPVFKGQQLAAGTELHTADKSKLNIRFADGSVVVMQSNSIMKLDTLSMYSGGGMVDTKLRLQQGKVEVEANPKKVQGNDMHIFTPTAVAAVRGTEFRVTTDSLNIRQETLNGEVVLSASGEDVAVKKGYGSLSENGQAPKPPVALLPAPDISNMPARLSTLPVVLHAPLQTNAHAWVGKIYQDAHFDVVIAENESQNTRLDFGNIPDGTYYLKLRAKDAQGLEGYDATHQFTLKARPFAPAPTFPGQSEIIRESKPTFSWSSVEGVNSYQVEIAEDAEFNAILQAERVGANQLNTLKALKIGDYFWRIASIDGSDIGPYSSVNQFSYKPKPPAPDVSKLAVKIEENRVFITTIEPPKGFSYEAMLDNEMNNQIKVWHDIGLSGKFDFLLREYGKQTLRLRLVDDGVAGEEAKVDFDAQPQWRFP